MLKIMLVLAALLGAVMFWQYRVRSAASAEQLARVQQLDPRKVEPATRALVLLEAIPRMRGSDREAGVKLLRDTLETIPRRIIAHHPPVPVEAIRFSGVGRTVLWYGKAAGGIEGGLWAERATNVAPWSARASGATFLDPAGTLFFKAALELDVVMSRDGEYLSRVEDGFLAIWGVQDFANRSGGERPLFLGAMPHATTRLECVQSTGICGVDGPGRLTLIDVKKGKTLRSISAERGAIVHMSPSGRLAGVAGPRAGMTIHAAHHDRKIQVDTSGLTLEDFAFSADEKSVVALDGNGVLHSYDAATGKPGARSQVVRHEQWNGTAHVETVRDGRFVVWDAGKVRLVSADLSMVVGRFDEGGEVVLIQTNAKGDRLAIARRTGPLTLWEVSPKAPLPDNDAEMMNGACARIGRWLTAEEWAAYIPDRPYFPDCR